jgi:hypothetical protein
MRRCLSVLMWIKSDVTQRKMLEKTSEKRVDIPSRTFEERLRKSARKHTKTLQ